MVQLLRACIVFILLSPTQLHATGEENPSPSSSDDHGDTDDEATQVVVPSTTHGKFEYAGDRDIFQIRVTQPGALMIDLRDDFVKGVLFAPSGKYLKTVTTPREPLPTEVAPGNYRFSLYHTDGTAPGSYNIPVGTEYELEVWMRGGARGGEEGEPAGEEEKTGGSAPGGGGDVGSGHASGNGLLENPSHGLFYSGIGVVSGWKCEATGQLTVRFNGGLPVPLAYPTERPDTAGVCGDTNNGFVAIWNWARLGDGPHTAVAYESGVEFARSTFEVATLGEEFVRGAAGECRIADFPSPGESALFEWNESTQHLEMMEERAPSDGGDAGGVSSSGNGLLENPSHGLFYSGIGVVSGWKCEVKGPLSVRFNGGLPVPLAYPTERPDTAGVCGDTDNGFVAIWNWARLGDGPHTAVAYESGGEFARSTFEVATLGEEFVRGAVGECRIADFPSPGESALFEWNESTQHLEMVGVLGPAPDDHGDSLVTATYVALGSATKGQLGGPMDEDYFEFDLDQYGVVELSTTGPTITYGELLYEDGRSVVGDSGETKPGSNFYLAYHLIPGKYFIRVHGLVFEDPVGYTLHVRWRDEGQGEEGEPSADDHGDTEVEATAVGLESATPGRIESEGDADYFKVTVEQPGTLVVQTTGSTYNGGRLRGPGVNVSGGWPGSDDGNFRFETSVVAGEYYVAVTALNYDGEPGPRAKGPYTLTVRFTADATPPELPPEEPGAGGTDDHGDSFITATMIGLNSSTQGEIDEYDTDYFALEIQESGTIEITLYIGSSRERVFPYVAYYSHESGPAAPVGSGPEDFPLEAYAYQPGRRYITVQWTGNLSLGTYTLEVKFTPDMKEPEEARRGCELAGQGQAVGPGGAASGETIANATPVPLWASVRCWNWTSGLARYLRVTTPGAGDLRIGLEPGRAGGGYPYVRVRGELLDSEGERVAGTVNEQNGYKWIQVSATEAETYYLRVWSQVSPGEDEARLRGELTVTTDFCEPRIDLFCAPPGPPSGAPAPTHRYVMRDPEISGTIPASGKVTLPEYGPGGFSGFWDTMLRAGYVRITIRLDTAQSDRKPFWAMLYTSEGKLVRGFRGTSWYRRVGVFKVEDPGKYRLLIIPSQGTGSLRGRIDVWVEWDPRKPFLHVPRKTQGGGSGGGGSGGGGGTGGGGSGGGGGTGGGGSGSGGGECRTPFRVVNDLVASSCITATHTRETGTAPAKMWFQNRCNRVVEVKAWCNVSGVNLYPERRACLPTYYDPGLGPPANKGHATPQPGDTDWTLDPCKSGVDARKWVACFAQGVSRAGEPVSDVRPYLTADAHGFVCLGSVD